MTPGLAKVPLPMFLEASWGAPVGRPGPGASFLPCSQVRNLSMNLPREFFLLAFGQVPELSKWFPRFTPGNEIVGCVGAPEYLAPRSEAHRSGCFFYAGVLRYLCKACKQAQAARSLMQKRSPLACCVSSAPPEPRRWCAIPATAQPSFHRNKNCHIFFKEACIKAYRAILTECHGLLKCNCLLKNTLHPHSRGLLYTHIYIYMKGFPLVQELKTYSFTRTAVCLEGHFFNGTPRTLKGILCLHVQFTCFNITSYSELRCFKCCFIFQMNECHFFFNGR